MAGGPHLRGRILTVVGNRTVGLVGALMNCAMVIILMTIVVHRSYELVHEVPDHVMGRIGGGCQMGEQQKANDIKGPILSHTTTHHDAATGAMTPRDDLGVRHDEHLPTTTAEYSQGT